MSNLPELVVVCQNKMGGVQNYYKNLLSAIPWQGFQKKVIYTAHEMDLETRLPEFFGVSNQEFDFQYNSASFYDTSKKLSEIIGQAPGLVFTNFSMELSALQHYPTQKSIVFVVHDEWFIQNAIRYGFLIDFYICHNPAIYELLKRIMPDRIEDIFYLPYGVKIPDFCRKENRENRLKLLFIGRFHHMKGIYDLPLIHQSLAERGIKVDWTIIGDGPEKAKFLSQMDQSVPYQHFSPDTNEELLKIAAQSDVFVLPSRLEGLPVSMLEAMSVGCVPVVGRFNDGIPQIVTEEIGNVLPIGEVDAFAEAIAGLDTDRGELEKKSRNARQKVKTYYEVGKNAAAYYEFVLKNVGLKSPRRSNLPIKYGSGRLDKPYIPGFVRALLRRIGKK